MDRREAGGCADMENRRFERLDQDTYQAMKRLAYSRLNDYSKNMTLNCTSLVHEAWLKLCNSDTDVPKNEDHFLAVASMAMRQILVDYLREKNAEKRGGGALRVTLQESRLAGGPAGRDEVDLLDLDRAISRLAEREPQLETLVTLRFFGGLSMERVARALDRSKRSVERDWTRARVYLYQELEANAG